MYPGLYAQSTPDKAAAIHARAGEVLTYADLDARSNRLAQLLWSERLRPGDHIAVFLEHHLRYFEVAWAAFRSGLHLTTVNRYLTDRASFMIISGGVNIYPQEIENELIMHSKVEDVAVIDVPHPEFGLEVKAFVQPVAGVDADSALAKELIAFARESLAPYKCPRSIDFEVELPRLPTGKLYKRLLKDRYWGEKNSRIV
jgi:long-chain acyl-CoA synthetase